MNVMLERYQKHCGVSMEVLVMEFVNVQRNPAARMILEMALNEQNAIIDDVLDKPRTGDPDIRKNIEFKLGEASGLKKLIAAVQAAGDYSENSK